MRPHSAVHLIPPLVALACATDPDVPRGAELVLSHRQHDFGAVMLGLASEPLRLILVNRGDGRSGEVSVVLDGRNAADFTVVRDLCSWTLLRSGGTCTIELRLRPTSAGVKEAVVRASAPPDHTVSATIVGTGTDRGLHFSTDTLAFGGILVGTVRAQTLSLKNMGALPTGALVPRISGRDSSAFTITRDGCGGRTLELARLCDMEISFDAASAGNREATLTVQGSPGGEAVVRLVGSGGLPTPLAAFPATLNFGLQRARVLGWVRAVTFTNRGSRASAPLRTLLDGRDFSNFTIANDGCAGRTLRPSENCVVWLRFEPIAAGPHSATLEISDDYGSSQTASLAGTGGTVTLELSPGDLDFGGRMVGSGPADTEVKVRNTGSMASGLVTGLIGCRDPGQTRCDLPFNVIGSCGSILPGGTCLLAVRFTPAPVGLHEGRLIVEDFASAAEGTIRGMATGLYADPVLTFAPTTVGVPSAPAAFVVINLADQTSGTMRTFIDNYDFEALADECHGRTLPPGASCRVTLRAVARSRSGPVTGGITVEAAPGGVVLTQLIVSVQ